MVVKGNAIRYGVLAAALHWVSALAVLAMLALGFMAARSSDPARIAALLRVHVPLGMLVLALTVTRMVWWLFDRRPDEPGGQPHWQRLVAHATHTLIYGVLVLIGTSGIGLMVLSGAGSVLFLDAPGQVPSFADLAPMKVHALGAFALLLLLSLHVGAACYHQLYRGDRLLARMGLSSTSG